MDFPRRLNKLSIVGSLNNTNTTHARYVQTCQLNYMLHDMPICIVNSYRIYLRIDNSDITVVAVCFGNAPQCCSVALRVFVKLCTCAQ